MMVSIELAACAVCLTMVVGIFVGARSEWMIWRMHGQKPGLFGPICSGGRLYWVCSTSAPMNERRIAARGIIQSMREEAEDEDTRKIIRR
jgi:hypothetical protein